MAGVCEPSPEEVGTIVCLRTLLTWAGVPGNIHHPGSPAGSLVMLAGLKVPTQAQWDAGVIAGKYQPDTLHGLNWSLLKAFSNSDPADWKDELRDHWHMAKMGDDDLNQWNVTGLRQMLAKASAKAASEPTIGGREIGTSCQRKASSSWRLSCGRSTIWSRST